MGETKQTKQKGKLIMNKINIIVMALAFLAALTQCKKEQVTPANDSKAVAITLDIKTDGGTKVDVNTGTGAVTYQSGDVVYVASGGKYIGTLTHNGTRFSGTIDSPVEGEPLHFFFLGNVTPAETLTTGTTQTCSVVISDQTERLPVIEYAPSDQNYTAGMSNFSAFLLNKCALVKFNVTTSSSAATCITGFNNKVMVDFSSNTLTPSKEGTGIIKLAAGSGEKWAILLPQNAMAAGAAGSAYSADGVCTGTHGAVPAITDNGYLTSGIDVTVTLNPGGVPTGAICGKFTINYNGDQVYFSQGNLQYIGSAATPYWKFADHQWDYLGTTTGQYSSDQNVDRDLFGWGTSGYHDANDPYNVNYQPWSTSTTYLDNSWNIYNVYGYGPSINMTDPYLMGTSANYDWGVNNPISNGGNNANLWRTLSVHEVGWVFFYRSTASNIRFAKANVNGVNGVILLPDDWNVSTYNLNDTDDGSAGFDSNIISVSQWSALEQAGAVFLPAAGDRRGVSAFNGWYGAPCGFYWLRECVDNDGAFDYDPGLDPEASLAFYFYEEEIGADWVDCMSDIQPRCMGFSVRLVRDL